MARRNDSRRTVRYPDRRQPDQGAKAMTAHPYVPHFETVAGEYYYVVDCPVTGRPLPFERDRSRGKVPFPPGPLVVSCAYCQKTHDLPAPQVSSHPAGKKE